MATLIDTAAILFIWLLVGIVMSGIVVIVRGQAASDAESSALARLLCGSILVIWHGYYIVAEGVLSTTTGKLVMGLSLRTVDGRPINWRESTVRTLLRWIDGLFFYLLGALIIWSSPQRQRLGDRVAGTVVVRR